MGDGESEKIVIGTIGVVSLENGLVKTKLGGSEGNWVLLDEEKGIVSKRTTYQETYNQLVVGLKH